MSNTLGLYDPTFYAQEALIQLEENLGLAGAVYRDYDKEPTQKGSTIKIRRPTSFTAVNMPSGSASDIDPDEVSITVDQWKGVQFKLTDKELNYTQEQIIREHIRPAAYAVAKAIDTSVSGQYYKIPYYVAHDGTDPYKNFTAMRRVMTSLGVPDTPRFHMIGGELEEAYLNESLFHQANTGAGGSETQVRGTLGRKFGFDTFVNQNIPSHSTHATPITDGGADAAIDGGGSAVDAGTSTITVDGTTLTGNVAQGDIIELDGYGTYAITAAASCDSNAIDLNISPALRQDIPDDTGVTFVQADKDVHLGFHRNAFALAMAPLSDLGNRLGASVETVADPKTRLALRSTMWYEEKDAEIWVRLDALWGVQVLDPDLAVRVNK